MGEGLSSSPFLQNIALFVVWVSQPAGTPYSSLRVWLESQTNPDFHHLAGNCGSDNRDFAFILYAWLGYCCFSPLPWFSSSPGISPDFARYILAAEVPLSTGVTIDADQGWPVLQSGLNEGALLEEYGFLLKNVFFSDYSLCWTTNEWRVFILSQTYCDVMIMEEDKDMKQAGVIKLNMSQTQ